MSNKHGGRRIKIEVWEYPYPHSESAKQHGLGHPFKVFQTEYKRPINAFGDFMGYWAKQANNAFLLNKNKEEDKP
jgi:hypothetical protein